MSRPKCRNCEIRPPRRFCPGLNADICAVCCGTEREMTIDCPLDCEYLAAARQFEKPQPPPAEMAYPEVRVTDEFLREHWQLATASGRLLFVAAASTPGAIDLDVRDALEALVRTYKTKDSGLVYESRPANPIAAQIQARFEHEMAQLREDVARQTGIHSIRDNDVLGMLVFYARTEQAWNNGRRRSRAFMDSLRKLVPPGPAAGEGSGLVV